MVKDVTKCATHQYALQELDIRQKKSVLQFSTLKLNGVALILIDYFVFLVSVYRFMVSKKTTCYKT